MQKWEYTKITFAEANSTYKYKRVSYGGSNEFSEYSSELEILDRYGSKGWELVCVEPDAGYQGSTYAHIYHFKRPIEG